MGKTLRNYRRNTTSRRFRNKLYISKFIQELKNLYSHCKHDEDKFGEKQKYMQHNITYGEMTYEGIEALYTHIIKEKYFQYLPHCFIDVGSGRGKLCLYMSDKINIDQVIGIELVKSRYDDAEELKNELEYNFPISTNKVMFLNSNVLDLQFQKIVATSPVFVWFSNLCFDENITDSIYAKLINELPIGTIICSSKPPTSSTNCIKLQTITIPMSWSENSNVYIFQTTD